MEIRERGLEADPRGRKRLETEIVDRGKGEMRGFASRDIPAAVKRPEGFCQGDSSTSSYAMPLDACLCVMLIRCTTLPVYVVIQDMACYWNRL